MEVKAFEIKVLSEQNRNRIICWKKFGNGETPRKREDAAKETRSYERKSIFCGEVKNCSLSEKVGEILGSEEQEQVFLPDAER